MTKGLPACSIQALQQASSILSKITGSMYAAQGENEEETLSNAGNSFGRASYGSQSARMANGQGRGRGIAKLMTRDRCHVNSASSHTNTEIAQQEKITTCEMDNHVDTCCLGPNFTLIYFTGKVCDMSSFLQDLPNQEAIPICTAAMAYKDNYGQTHIIVINKALQFGTKLDISLINPNQIRALGILLCDDPTDPNRDIGMYVQQLNLPFTMKGMTCSFISRMPMAWELDNCPHLEITSDMEWDPKAMYFLQDSGESGQDDLSEGYWHMIHDTSAPILTPKPSLDNGAL